MSASGLRNEDTSQMLRALLSDAFEQGALEVHFEWHPELSKTLCLLRLDGELRLHREFPAGMQSQLVAQLRMLGGGAVLPRREPAHLFATPVLRGERTAKQEPLGLTFLPMVNGEEDVVVERLMDWTGIFSLDKAIADPECVAILKGVSSGTVLFAGGLGGGQNTLAMAYLGTIAAEGSRKIISLSRDGAAPANWMREMERKEGTEITAAVRAAMMASPDVIHLGRVDSPGHVAAATHASREGHRVVATIRARTLMDALVSYLEYGTEIVRPRTVAQSLEAILYSRIMRRLCRDCRRADDSFRESELKREAMATNDIREHVLRTLVERFHQDNGRIKVWHAMGCSSCDGAGYRGYIAIVELLPVTRAVRELPFEGSGYSQLADVVQKERIRTFAEDGLLHVLEGDLSIEQMRTAAESYRSR